MKLEFNKKNYFKHSNIENEKLNKSNNSMECLTSGMEWKKIYKLEYNEDKL